MTNFDILIRFLDRQLKYADGIFDSIHRLSFSFCQLSPSRYGFLINSLFRVYPIHFSDSFSYIFGLHFYC